MLRKTYVIPIVCMLMLVGCKSDEVNKASNESFHMDNTFVMLKNEEDGDEVLSQVYVKSEESDNNKIASDIPAYNKVDYLEGKKSILIQDGENNLLKYDIEGNKETIGKELIGQDTKVVPYKMSANNETVVYLTQDESLYVKEKDKDKDKVANNVWSYEIDGDGKNVYYINDEENLYVYRDGESEKLASDVSYFKISNDGNKVVFIDNEENLYIRDINSDDKDKINSGTVDISTVKIYQDGIVTFLSDFDYSDYKGELYIYNGSEKNKIASDVIQYIKKGDKFYFINEDNTLYEKSLDDEKSNKILSDVEYIKSINNGVVCVNKDGNIYSKQEGKDAIKIGKNLADKYMLRISDEDTIIYLTENNDLFIGENKIAQEVINYVYNSEIIAYTTEDKEVHSYNLKDKSDTIIISDAKEYSYIYLEDQLVFSNVLEPYDLAGFWEFKVDYSDETFMLEFSGSNKITGYFSGEEKGTIRYKIGNSSENYMSIEDDDSSVSIEKIDDLNIKLTVDGERAKGKKISKLEANKVMTKILNSTQSTEQEVSTNTQKNSDYIISDSDSRLLTISELNKYSSKQLSYIRNEIFARYGYIFQTDEYNDYFNKKEWYNPNASFSGDIEQLNSIEKENVNMIKELEGK